MTYNARSISVLSILIKRCLVNATRDVCLCSYCAQHNKVLFVSMKKHVRKIDEFYGVYIKQLNIHGRERKVFLIYTLKCVSYVDVS